MTAPDRDAFFKHHTVALADTVFRSELEAWHGARADQAPHALVDIGGGDGSNLADFLGPLAGQFDTHLLDLEPATDDPRRVCADITAPLPAEAVNRFDVLYSFNAFEHFKDPLTAADNCVRMLRPGGLCLIHTVFSWRYHPVPADYFRFTDDALRSLFAERNGLRTLHCGYDLRMRRMDIRGGYFGDRDIPPIDELGGFRENWAVFYVGVKDAPARLHPVADAATWRTARAYAERVAGPGTDAADALLAPLRGAAPPQDAATLPAPELALAEALLGGPPDGEDGGMQAVRARLPDTAGAAFRLGYGVIGPVIAATVGAAWAEWRGTPGPVFGVMRDGGFLADALAAAFPGTPVGKLWLSRRACALAALSGADDRDGLTTLLARMRGSAPTVAEALDLLALPADAPPMAPQQQLDADRLPDFLDWLARPAQRHRLADTIAEARRRLVVHLRDAGALDQPVLRLLDIGFAGNVQRLLGSALAQAGHPLRIEGHYVATTPGALWTLRAGGAVRGVLADLGAPAWFADPFVRFRDVIEAIATPDTGQHLGFDDQGRPVNQPSRIPVAQARQTAEVRTGALAFAAAWGAGALAAAAPAVRDHARIAALRLLIAPTAEEVALLGDWMHDDDMALGGLTPLVPHAPALADLAAMLAAPRTQGLWMPAAAVRDHSATAAHLFGAWATVRARRAFGDT